MIRGVCPFISYVPRGHIDTDLTALVAGWIWPQFLIPVPPQRILFLSVHVPCVSLQDILRPGLSDTAMRLRNKRNTEVPSWVTLDTLESHGPRLFTTFLCAKSSRLLILNGSMEQCEATWAPPAARYHTDISVLTPLCWVWNPFSLSLGLSSGKQLISGYSCPSFSAYFGGPFRFGP